MIRFPVFAALALAGCAAHVAPSAPAGHPASALTAASPAGSDVAALVPAAPATLPAALRPGAPADATAGMDHGAMAGMDHGEMTDMSTTEAPTRTSVLGLTATLDAVLAVHEALAADHLGDATARAAALASAFETLTAQPPADDVHLWHTNAADLATVRTQTAALASASDLDAARTAFGALSAPMIRLVQAVGVPAGYDVAFMSCGMAPGVPQGGVWMQRAGTTANPFFGSAMPTCGTRDEPASAR